MAARRGEGPAPHRAAVIALGLVAVALAAAPPPATAARENVTASKSRVVKGAPASLDARATKKKGKEVAPALTASSGAAFASGTTRSATATCPRRTHMTGGGFDVSPPFAPPGAGLRSVTSTSQPTGAAGWHASGSAFSTPFASGFLTTHARCESNALGKLAETISSTVILTPGFAQTFTFNCPRRTHVLSGGYAGAGAGGFTYLPNNMNPSNLRIIPLQSRRTGRTRWTVQALNSSFSPAAALFTGYAVCERNAKGRRISEASAFNVLVNDARASAIATCPARKQHVVSGGFLISPSALGTVPGTAIDEFQPVGKRTWHLGLHELVNVDLPTGSSVQGFAYCAQDAPPRSGTKKPKP